MKHLVYCILRSDLSMPGWNLPHGINAERVLIAAEDGLAAVYSVVPEPYAAPNVSRATAYAGVIKAFHEMQTVLPMRYGCFFENPAQIVELLQRRSRQFKASLEELDGCVEVGVRALLGGEGEDTLKNLPHEAGPLSAKAYMACRAAYYAEKDCSLRHAAKAAENMRRAFDGLFVKHEVQRSFATGARKLLSAFFLVRKEQLQSFHNAFHQFQKRSSVKMLLTGPWPPYNFVPPPDATAGIMEPPPYLLEGPP